MSPISKMPQAVVFDMDDVLCEYRFDIRLGALSRLSGKSPEFVEAAIWTSGFDEDGDRGRYSAQEYLAEFNRRLEAEISEADWIEARAQSIIPDQAILQLVRAVSQKATVALLTNNGPVFKRGMSAAFPELVDLFAERAFCAYEFGGAKPEVTVFEGLAGRLAILPENILFIDDTADYIGGARQAGLVAHHFTGALALKAELERLQLL